MPTLNWIGKEAVIQEVSKDIADEWKHYDNAGDEPDA
jgi:hypothetical protein